MNITIYVPNALGAKVKRTDINISRVCREALEQAVLDFEIANGEVVVDDEQ